MGVSIGKSPSYFWLNTWVLANIIELSTQSFCNRFVDFRLDPGRRLYDQMTQAARSIRANIAEGSGRHDTSLETEMRLTDVARASTHELMGDYMNFMMRHGIAAWTISDPRYQYIMLFKLDRPEYGNNILADVIAHIISQKRRLDRYVKIQDTEICANCLMVLCIKIISMLNNMLEAQLKDFKEKGGFTENMTQERMESRQQQSESAGAPACPECGAPMIKRMRRKGVGYNAFWGCSNYPRCMGSRRYNL